MASRRTAPLRALVVLQPFESHFRPLVPVIRALRALGYEELVAAPAKLHHLVTHTYGSPFAPVGADWAGAGGVAEALADVLTTYGNDAFCRTVIADYLAGPNVSATATDLTSLIAQWKPDAVISDITDFASSLVAEKLELPQLRFDNGWARLLSENAEILNPSLVLRRTAFGLPRAPGNLAPGTIFTPAPRELLLSDLPGNVVVSYQHENAQRKGERLPSELATLPTDRPLIYVSLGSILTRSPAFASLLGSYYQRIIDALAGVRCTAIISVGSELRRDFAPPPHIRVRRSVPQTLVLNAGTRLFITHAGFSSFREAIHAGVPMLFAPLSSDQLDNAERASAHGLGAVLDLDASVGTIREAVVSALDSAEQAATATYWRRRMLAEPPLDTVLSRHLTRRAPLA